MTPRLTHSLLRRRLFFFLSELVLTDFGGILGIAFIWLAFKETLCRIHITCPYTTTAYSRSFLTILPTDHFSYNSVQSCHQCHLTQLLHLNSIHLFHLHLFYRTRFSSIYQCWLVYSFKIPSLQSRANFSVTQHT